MKTALLRWKAMLGFLLMNFLTPGTSALVCFDFTSHHQSDFQDKIITAFTIDGGNVTCSSVHNACINAQLELSILSHTLFMNHQGCATAKQPNGGKESTVSGDKYFAIKYNANYCSADLCNAKQAVADVPKRSKWEKEMCKPSSSKKCYAGINFHDSEASLDQVTCRKDSDLCYQGSGYITIGNGATWLYIRSCQSTCTIPQRQVFGPIEISVLQGFCCSGSDCNKKKNAHPPQNNSTQGVPGVFYGKGAGNHTTNSTNLDSGYGLHWNFECEDYVEDSWTALPTLHPIDTKGAAHQLRPLLVTLGLTALGLWRSETGFGTP